jgi:hypothetical protein
VERPQSLSSLRLEQLVVTTESQFGARTAGNLEATTETIGSHRVYSLPGRYQMGPGETMAVPLFEPVALMVERVHLVQSASPIGPTAPGTPGQEIPIEIQYRAERTKGTAFGDRSLPAGIVSIYDGVPGRETLIAEGQLSHTPAATPFLVNGGRALDVRAYRASSGYQIIQDSVVNPSGSMTVRATAQVETLEWTLTNGSDSVVVAELVERQPGKWRVVQSSVPPEAIVGGVRFRVTVPARGEAKASYRIRIDQDE